MTLFFLFITLFVKLNSIWCLSKSKSAKYYYSICIIICIIICFVLLTFTNYAVDAEFVLIMYNIHCI